MMQDKLYFLNFNKKILKIDFFSVLFGVIGIILGVVSIIALLPFWNSKSFSMWITVVAIVFDCFSFGFAFWAFYWMFIVVRKHKIYLKNENIKIYQLDWLSIWSDFTSFTVGVIGAIFELISIFALLPFWNDETFSTNITIVALVFDVVSTTVAVIATLVTVKIVKYYKSVT